MDLRLDLLPVAPDRVVLQLEALGPVHEEVVHTLERLDALGYCIAATHPTGPDAVRALKVARRIRSGTISVNGGNYFSPDVPFGGYKQSGIGREMGVPGLEEFLERKSIAVARS